MKRLDKRSPTRVSGDQAAEPDVLGIDALAFLAADEDRLGDFLAASGITHVNLRDAAAEPGFLRGILSYLASDERLLIAFAAHLGQRPDAVGQAIARWTGPSGWGPA